MFLKHRKVAVELPPPAHKDEREYTPIGPVSQSMPSPRPATEIEYLERRSPLCGVVLRDHSRERLIRCHVKLRFGCIVHLNGKPFSFNRTSFSFKRTSFSLKRTPFSFQTFTHTLSIPLLPARYEHPLVLPHVIQRWQVPLRTISEPQTLQAGASPIWMSSPSAPTGSVP